nr:neural-cadherin-like [Procambarus clarkii]
MRSVGMVGQLYATKTLDYENETHRRGFKFMVQVTDRGRGGWTDPRHLDAAWVSVRLRDVNDNPPVFPRPHAHVTVREDAAPGTLLIALPASDPDMGGIQEVSYKVKGGWDALTVDAEGGVSLWRALDREAPDGAIGVAQIISVDRGMPPLSATATLTITVSDVNDCPPRLLPPTLLHVTEAGPPTLLGVLTATDHDVWALGHGPPFNLSLAPTNPAHVLSHVSLTFDSHLDSGRGGAELWTVRAVDREQHPQLLVEVWAADAQGLSVTHTVTVVIDDLNDNPMKPAAKTVYLWKTQGGGPDAPLGRVYVDDPDDWDLADKTFRWVGSPHPLFSLNPDDGTIFASSQVREGRYELQFGVSDRVWGQRGVAANVTVAVKVLTPDALAHAAPVTLTPTTPADLTRGWTPTEGGGRLGGVIEAIRRVVGESSHTVDVVSVYGHPHNPPPHTTSDTLQGDHTVVASSSFAPDGDREFDAGEFEGSWSRPSSCVWVSVREAGGGFMDPVKLQGLLALNTGQLEERTHLTVVAEDAAAGRVEPQDPLQDHALPPQEEQQQQPSLPSTLGFGIESEPSSAATRASTALPLQVVDTNVTSLVTPRLTRALACHAHEPESCTPISCLNGGGCLRTSSGNRCVCPQGSVGPRCKVLARTFSGAGWAWVRPLPPCLPLTISFRVLTRRSHALLLFSGPLAPHPRRPHSPPTPMLAVQLWEGRPQVVLEGGGSPLKLEVNTTVNDGDWHLLHLHLNAQGVSVMVDLCGRGWHDRSSHDSHCITRAEWVLPTGGEAWAGSPPLQVGGLAHAPPRPDDHGWVEAPTARPLEGCVSHLTLNGQLVDLGEPAYSQGSVGGCHPQDAACPGGLGGCGRRGQCVGGLLHPQCECDPGWSGLGCATPTTPAALGKSSYMKVALSFTPAPRVVTVQLRVRTRGPRNGLLLRLAAHHRSAAFTLHLRAGVACVSVSGAGWATRAACVEGRPVGDGAWHTIVAERHGHNLAVSVDDGDGWRRNESLVSLLQGPGARGVRVSPGPLEVDKHDGVTVGGMPEFAGVSLVTVHEDLSDSCIDDLRVSGRPLPLPPAVNGTSWGQVTTSERFTRGCPAPDACLNTTCAPPLSCTSTWGRATCSCGAGGQLVDDTVCEDVDECLWRPCLNGGSCYNLRPGYLCVCGPGRTGDNCEWGGLSPDSHPFTAPVAIAALTLSRFLLVVVGVVFSIRLHRKWLGRALAGRQVGDVGGRGGGGGEEGTIIAVKGGMEEDSGKPQAQGRPRRHISQLPQVQPSSSSPSNPEESCGAGGQLVDDTVCEDVDECLWRPCLHGGSCYNLRPGYLCVCGPGRTGDNCEWGGLSPDSHPFTAPVAIAALTLSLFLLVVVGVVFSIRLHRQWLGRALAGRQVGDVGGVGGVGGEEGTIIAVKGGMEEDSGSIRLKEDPDDTFLNCLKYNHLQAHPPTQRKAEESPARPESSSHHTLVKEPSAADVSARVRAADAAPEPLLPQDDLRAYAYEGDGSSAGSLSSAISGLKAELDDDGNMKPLVSEFLEVMDLLRNLPEASKSPSLLTKLDRKSGLQGSGTPGGPDVPPTPRSSIKSSTPTACGASPAHRRETRHTPPRHASSPRSKEELSTAC